MYTILLNETNELITSVKERIMQRSKLVDNLHFLVEPDYKGIDMSDFTVTMEYILPVSREYKTESLVKSEALYKGMLEYKLPFDTYLTKEAGKIEVQLTFTKVELDEDGNSKQMVRKTSPVTITILPISAWSDIIPDSALSALDQRIIMTQAMLEAANEMANSLDETKADNMIYNEDGKYIQLTAAGNPIGNKIFIQSASGTDVVVSSIEVDEEGNLIVNYSNGTTDNVGKVGGGACAGIYIPSLKEDILTFTLADKATEPVISVDINKSNDWSEVNGDAAPSDYIWNKL